ncbi:MAG: hypothetical protein KAG53_00375 [Endozoicomonadaceae bacterium]|nr:hypothetical protein [Endozoicomonadaceae bacterium]
MIRASVVEAASYSLAVNSERNKISRTILAMGAAVTSLLYRYQINKEEVIKLIVSDPDKYNNCRFAISLKKRMIIKSECLRAQLGKKVEEKVEVVEEDEEKLSDNLRKYENHFKIAIETCKVFGRSTVINKMRNPTNPSEGKPEVNTDFYELSDSVVLCELPKYVSKKHLSTTRFDKFDAVIVLIDQGAVDESTRELANMARNSSKPCVIVDNQFFNFDSVTELILHFVPRLTGISDTRLPDKNSIELK